jgi:hypothetical protein
MLELKWQTQHLLIEHVMGSVSVSIATNITMNRKPQQRLSASGIPGQA